MTMSVKCKTDGCTETVSFTEQSIPAFKEIVTEDDRDVELTCALGHTHKYFIKDGELK